MNIELPKNVEYILNKLEGQGYRADVVGGPVRDFLLGKSPADYDITTSATPDEIKRIFSDERTVDTGIKHGTVSVILDGAPYEVTTYRIDGEYKDSRHPETVTFTSKIEEDLRRRDFTMNAIAYNPNRGITDCYGGREDVEAGIIRAVGEPELRFREDALRILRGVRFASVLGFNIEEETKAAMLKTRHLLANVSVERIYVELKKTISAAHSYKALSEFSEIILGVIPELSGLKLPTEALYKGASYPARLISLFYLNSDTSKDSYKRALTRLHTDSHIREVGASVLPLIKNVGAESDIELKYILRDVGEECAGILVETKILLGIASAESADRLESLIKRKEVYKLSDLKIDGKDLIALGVKGPQVGKILGALLTEVIEDKCRNEKEALLSLARSMIASH